MANSESKWLIFVEVNVGETKTKKFEVYNKEYNELLGRIKWYGAWRQYAFMPESKKELVFEKTCLKDISEFLNNLMNERKEIKK